MKRMKISVFIFLLAVALPSILMAGEADPASTNETLQIAINTIWVLLAAFLVFFMQAGFGMVESGFIRAKNTSNILTKNFLDFCMASLGFFMFGYAIMFGTGNDFLGLSGWFLIDAKSATGDVPLFAYWLFQAAFCGAAATIVAGGMAERMKFPAYLIYSFIISAFIYPLVGHWIWGGGWLAAMNFADFAGSTVVHTVGGMAALIGTILLKPRIGKYRKDGSANLIAGHNIPLASLGVFILWFGWFGFNAGSTIAVDPSGELISRIAMNTSIAAAAGGIAALVTVWIKVKKADLSMTMNGALAGLVAITAPCAYVDPWAAIVIGIIGGVIVVLGAFFLDKIHVDDPVGAVPVHGFCGIWGTLAVGIFGQEALGLANQGLIYGGGFAQLGIQALGSLATIVFIVVAMGTVFKLIDLTIGLRVSREEEYRGLDIGEHGMQSYSGFQIID
ncbi:MAG: ammonium transporter [Spirochaetales bacterium]|nr:ammonium transporter [Spirochaetales bacterium]